MMIAEKRELYRDSPATYRIRVQGELDERWYEYTGLTITVSQAPDEAAVSTLTGQLVDQAAVLGVLNNLYDRGYSLLSVECLDCE